MRSLLSPLFVCVCVCVASCYTDLLNADILPYTIFTARVTYTSSASPPSTVVPSSTCLLLVNDLEIFRREIVNSYCLACWWIVQIITPRRNYFPRALIIPSRGDNLHYPPTSQAITVLLYQTFYNKGQNHKTRPELVSIF